MIDNYHHSNDGYYQSDDDYFGNSKGDFERGDNPIDRFGTDYFDENYFDGITGQIKTVDKPLNAGVNIESPYFNGVFGSITTIISIFLCSLEIGIATLYLRLSRNEYDGFNREMQNSFVVSFHNGYGKKVGVVLVKRILIYLYTLLLIIPGIIEGYKLYFVEFIMAENPNLTISQVNEISKKMTANHKTELFKLDLSFIGWYILVIMTLGLANIYAMPYIYATKALYYQNFKARCMQEYKLSPLDFMSDEERRQNYNNFNNGNNGNYGQPNYYNGNYNYAGYQGQPNYQGQQNYQAQPNYYNGNNFAGNQGQPNYYNANNTYAGNQAQQAYYNSNMGFNGAQPNYQNPNMNYNGNMPNQNYQYSNVNVNNQQFNQTTNPNYAQNGYANVSNGNYGTTSPNAQSVPNQPNSEQYGESKADAANNDGVSDEKPQNVSVDDVVNSDTVNNEVVEDLNQKPSAPQTEEVSKDADELD